MCCTVQRFHLSLDRAATSWYFRGRKMVVTEGRIARLPPWMRASFWIWSRSFSEAFSDKPRYLTWLENCTPTRRGVTRLDGARGKKQVWCPHVQTWDLLDANLLYWKKYLWHCWDFSAPLAVIRGQGNCALALLITPLPTPLGKIFHGARCL